MRIAGGDKAIANLVKWSNKDEWAPYLEEVLASHMGAIVDNFGMAGEDLAEVLGDASGMLYGVILEDFFSAWFGDEGEVNVVDDYLKRRGWRETASAKRYLIAIRDSVMSLHEVVDLDPGKTMTVRDMIRGGDPVIVEEKLGSESAARWDRIAARLVTVNNKPHFTGGMLLLSHEASREFLLAFDKSVKTFRAKLRRESKTEGKDLELALADAKAMLLANSGPRLFTQTWLIDALESVNAPLPEIRNTDGDEILFSEVRFSIVVDEDKVAAVIDGIENIERDVPDGSNWSWHGPGSPTQRVAANKRDGGTLQTVDESGRTSLGGIEIRDRVLYLSTNSWERAERGRDLLAAHLGSLVGPPLTSHEAVESALAKSRGAPVSGVEEIPPEVAKQVLHDYLDGHYRQTLDHPLPALDDKSPRQAAKTKRDRARVIDWLKYLENGEHRRAADAGQEAYDMSWMWRELKLEEDR